MNDVVSFAFVKAELIRANKRLNVNRWLLPSKLHTKERVATVER